MLVFRGTDRMRAFLISMTLAGMLVPTIWFGLHWLVPGFDHWWLVDAPSWLEGALLVAWPTSLLLMADPEERNIWIPLISVGLNVLLYGVVGMVLYIGRRRKMRRFQV